MKFYVQYPSAHLLYAKLVRCESLLGVLTNQLRTLHKRTTEWYNLVAPWHLP